MSKENKNNFIQQFHLLQLQKVFSKLIYIYIYIYILGMCISITEADAIRISMHSQRYDTLKIHMKQLAMRCDTIHPYYDAVRFDFDFESIQHNAIRCNGKNMIAFISLVQTDSKS